YMGSIQLGIIRFIPPVSWLNWNMSNSPLPDNYIQCVSKKNNHVLFAGMQLGGLVVIDESPDGIAVSESTPVQIFPNPAQTSATIFLNRSFYQTKICVFDVHGKICQEELINGNSFLLDPELKTGTYFLELRTAEDIVLHTKIVVVSTN
ncbi:MAG: T9SS type A sorting domain-containing protein, partial [Bacteroidia bacterium]